jgi:predicted transcriptional regulator
MRAGVRCGMLPVVPEQIAIRLDDELGARARAEASTVGATLSDWVRDAIRHHIARETARRARAQEDARGPLYTPEQEVALLASRVARARQAFTFTPAKLGDRPVVGSIRAGLAVQPGNDWHHALFGGVLG